MRKLIAGIVLVGLLGTAHSGQTQDYPARPVTMIVPLLVVKTNWECPTMGSIKNSRNSSFVASQVAKCRSKRDVVMDFWDLILPFR